ncbi:hypothetical protein JSQ81_14895 [Sporosarcina sp. Marseille-Q4063]|uniref:hypothetical protein n=1 Tax=Sporosarcina sp. Marseille-Q4063 TaxID=2810514 RepID=UPI001BAEC0C9|nr:hypothetical protein [Sporosarcina sp. Marseille-Q4063]QUW21087.1 hypothetical protein JSQ81_14895 [Sporosarcina sp. Marseille-Q4063]
MNHLSDDDMIKGLETLGQSFQPSATQKENSRRHIFQPNRHKKGFHIQKWVPTIVSLVVLISVSIGIFVLINNESYIGAGESTGNGALITDVTASWDRTLLRQTSTTSPTKFEIIFDKDLLFVFDRFQSFEYNPDESLEEAFAKYKIKESPLVVGEFTEYRVVKKSNEMYTIEVTGRQGFTYTLKKVAPRKFVGEEGIEYSTGTYVE